MLMSCRSFWFVALLDIPIKEKIALITIKETAEVNIN